MDFFLALCPYYLLKDLGMKLRDKWTIVDRYTWMHYCHLRRTGGRPSKRSNGRRSVYANNLQHIRDQTFVMSVFLSIIPG